MESKGEMTMIEMVCAIGTLLFGVACMVMLMMAEWMKFKSDDGAKRFEKTYTFSLVSVFVFSMATFVSLIVR